jgi:hypothetical protein
MLDGHESPKRLFHDVAWHVMTLSEWQRTETLLAYMMLADGESLVAQHAVAWKEQVANTCHYLHC